MQVRYAIFQKYSFKPNKNLLETLFGKDRLDSGGMSLREELLSFCSSALSHRVHRMYWHQAQSLYQL